MSNKIKTGALVIGSKDHKLAEKCIDWGEHAYIGDYTLLIVNVASLDRETLEKIIQQSPDYFEKLRNQIIEVQTKRGLSFVCITDKFISLGPVTSDNLYSDNGEEMKVNNYSWCPIIPLFSETPGEKIDRKSIKSHIKYFTLLKGWERLYSSYCNNTYFKFDKNKTGLYFKAVVNKLVTNEIGRVIVFELYWRIHKHYDYNVELDSNGPILFLPKVEDINRGIDLLLEDYIKIGEAAPEWINEVNLQGEIEMVQQMQGVGKKIEQLEENKNKMKMELEGLNDYKRLLYSTGKELEDIVEKSFDLFNIKLKRVGEGFKEDRIFEDEGAEIPVEIRGKNAGLNENDLNQLTSRFVDKPACEKYKTRGLFVLNHFREIKPGNREAAFHHNIIEKAKPWQVCLIATKTLFQLVKIKLQEEEINNLKEILFNTVGVFDSSKIKPSNPLPKNKPLSR